MAIMPLGEGNQNADAIAVNQNADAVNQQDADAGKKQTTRKRAKKSESEKLIDSTMSFDGRYWTTQEPKLSHCSV
jgi:hypothetical protein